MWYIKANVLATSLDLVERTSQGIWVAGFDQSNPNGRTDWEQAIAAYRHKRVLSVPQDRDGKSPYSLKIMEPGSASHAIIMDLIRYCDGCNRTVILGHPLGAGAEINVGGDPAAIYGDAISRATKYRAQNLAESISHRWLPTYYRYMFPGVATGRFRFLTDHPDADALLSYAERLAGLGWTSDLDALSRLCGLPKSQPGNQVFSRVNNLNPVAVENGPPQQVPIAGNAPPPSPVNSASVAAQAVPTSSEVPVQ